jgi:hypothetical protein
MTDRREAILSRLTDILNANDGGWTVYRNKLDLTENMAPCFVLFDGHEERVPVGESLGMRTQGIGLVKMTPGVRLYMGDDAELLGSGLNAMRVSIYKAIMTDAILLDELTFNGDMIYEGMHTELQRNAQIIGELTLIISFTYMLNPAEF